MSGQIIEEDVDFEFLNNLKNMKHDERCSIFEIKFVRTISETFQQNSEEFHRKMISVINMFPNLKRLTITNYFNLMDDHVADLRIKTLENLELLHLINNQHLSSKSFERIANNCTRLTNFYFTIESGDDNGNFYNVRNDDLLLLLRRNFEMDCLGLALDSLPNSVLVEFCHHTKLSSLSLCLSSFIDSIELMKIIFHLLGKFRTFLNINVDKRNIVAYDLNYLSMNIVGMNFCSFRNFDAECIHLFKSSENTFHSICLTGFTNLTNKSLGAIGESSSDLHTVKLLECGKNYDIDGVRVLFENAKRLQLMLVTCGDLSLGMSGECFTFGTAVLAVLNKGDWFKHSVFRQLKRENKMSGENFDDFADYCVDFQSDSSDSSDNENCIDDDIDHIDKKQRVMSNI
jgi:hypothetical protein